MSAEKPHGPPFGPIRGDTSRREDPRHGETANVEFDIREWLEELPIPEDRPLVSILARTDLAGRVGFPGPELGLETVQLPPAPVSARDLKAFLQGLRRTGVRRLTLQAGPNLWPALLEGRLFDAALLQITAREHGPSGELPGMLAMRWFAGQESMVVGAVPEWPSEEFLKRG